MQIDLDFSSLEGHEQALEALRKGGRKEPFPSLVFEGPAHVGKRLVGIWYAAFLNCLDSEAQAPCGVCRSCKKIKSGIHPDLHLTRVPEKKTVVGVSEVREAIYEVHHAPFEGNFRVWVIEEGERLSDEAQNALLKTLEEPPERAIILLVTNLGGTLIPTVSSRCRLVRFHVLQSDRVEKALLARGASDSQAKRLSALCSGAFGSALSLFSEPKSLEERDAVLELFSSLPGKDLWGAVETAQRLEKTKLNGLGSVLDLGISFFRDLLVLSAGSVDLVVHRERMDRLQELASVMSAAKIRFAIQELQEADHFVQRNVSPRLLLQRLCINLSKAC